MLIVAGGTAQAQRGPKARKANRKAAVIKRKNVRVIKRVQRNRVVVVKKRRGRTITALPKAALAVRYNKLNYHFHAGRYYRPSASKFILVIPPRGLRIKTLPPGTHRFMWKKRAYHYHLGVYYVQQGEQYETADAEEGMIVPNLPEDLVHEVTLDGKSYAELDGVLYQKVDGGYQVIAELED